MTNVNMSRVAINVTNEDGSSPALMCNDPVATNYTTSGPDCTYNPVPAGKTGLTTFAPFGMYMSETGATQKRIFINWAGGSNTVAAGNMQSHEIGTKLPSKYLFVFSRHHCVSRNGTQAEQLYYGDYVQLGQASESGTTWSTNQYFNPNNSGTNGFGTDPGTCQTTNWQTFQILHVGTDGNVSVNSNNPVLVGDDIAIVSVNTASGGPTAGTALSIGSGFVTSKMTKTALTGAPASQHAVAPPSPENKMLGGHYMDHTEFAMHAAQEFKSNSIFTIDNAIIAILVLAVLYLIWVKIIKKK